MTTEAPLELVTCEACDGLGVEVFGIAVYEHGCNFPHASTDERPCTHCRGLGELVREAA